jgi:Holliday junction resolvasome RuvABC endonuclease subunit
VRSVGVDIASAGLSALALVVDGEPRSAKVWKPKNVRDSTPERIHQFHKWMTFTLGTMNPDVVAVEELAVFLNKKVIRALSRHEGAALLAAKQRGVVVVNPPVTQARGIVFGKGNISKDEAWEAIKKMYPDFKFLPKTSGGTDQADALVHALAAPTILERR